ncbi:MAG: RNA polymerase sigma factor [Bacteroidales bacterium]|jgi:RNA polymerase sigma-70 factor (ECF subfamily)|nr:RNA polymerase sigma factor [Bacteroidales bacterium]
MDDLVVARRIADGDKKVFEMFFNEYNIKLLNLCYGMLHNKTEAEDLVQEIFIDILSKAKGFKGNSKFSVWVYRIAINKTISHIRKRKIRNIFSALTNEQVADTESDDDDREVRFSDLKLAVDTLPLKERTAIVLYAYDEMSQKDIAEVMQSNTGAIGVLIHRAKKMLKQKLKEKYKEIE